MYLSAFDDFGTFFTSEKILVLHNLLRILLRLGILFIEVGKIRGVVVEMGLIVRANLVNPVEGSQRLGHVGLVLAFGDKVIASSG